MHRQGIEKTFSRNGLRFIGIAVLAHLPVLDGCVAIVSFGALFRGEFQYGLLHLGQTFGSARCLGASTGARTARIGVPKAEFSTCRGLYGFWGYYVK